MGGHLTQKILLEQGVPQGDIISPFIFIIAVEILLIKISKSKNIRGIPLGSSECRALAYADDTSFGILREEQSLRACMSYITHFHTLSGLSANIDKTKVVPLGNITNPKLKMCPDIPLEWTDNFTLLGIEIDNELAKLDQNFDRIFYKTETLINDWRSRHLPIEGRRAISKALLISQYTYVATIINLTPTQIAQAQQQLNNYVLNIDTNKKTWISRDRLYLSTSKGGFGCMEMSSYFEGLQLAWMKRYTVEAYQDHWTDILDNCLNITPATRKTILKWGDQKFTPPITKCKTPFLQHLLKIMQKLYTSHVTDPATGDNTFACQPIFHNSHIQFKKFGDRHQKCFTQEYFGLSPKLQLTVNEVFHLGDFINYDKFKTLCLKSNSKTPGENSYLALKKHLTSLFGHNKKYPKPIVNKTQKPGTFSSIYDLFMSKSKKSRKFRNVLFSPKYNFSPTPWHKALNDFSITEHEVMTSFRNANAKILEPFTHDKKVRLLQRKTQFRNQLSKHSPVDPYCEWCSSNLNDLVSEDMKHALFSCPKLLNKPREIASLTGIGHLISDPIEAKEVILSTTEYSKDTNIVANAVWMSYLRIILELRDTDNDLNTSDVSKKIIYEISGSIKMFPSRPLGMSIRNLGLMDFFASHYPGIMDCDKLNLNNNKT